MRFSIQCQQLSRAQWGRWACVRYIKAPILEAVLEFRWSSAKTLDELTAALRLPEFEGFEEPTPRIQLGAAFDIRAGSVSHEQHQLGFEVALREGSDTDRLNF